MIQLTALGVDIHKYTVNGSYRVNVTPVTSGNGFTAQDGTVFSAIQGHKTTISCELKSVPHAVAEQIAATVQADKFELAYTTPITITEFFRCTKYDAQPKFTDPRQKDPSVTENITWNISLSMESASIAATDGDSL